jgi:hypothetical protein
MKQIRSYAQAYDYWHAEGCQEATPLDGVRKQHVVMVAQDCVRQNDAPTAFFMRFYDTDLVRYFADGSVACLTHDSMSSRAFLRNVLPLGVDVVAMGGTRFVVPLEGKTLYMPQGICSLDTRHGLRLIASSAEPWFTANRVAYHKARTTLRPFVDWYRMVHRLSPSPACDIFYPADEVAYKVKDQSLWGDLLNYTLQSVVRRVADHYNVLHRTVRPLEVKPTPRKIVLCGVQLV